MTLSQRLLKRMIAAKQSAADAKPDPQEAFR
jgi:hypothetical protein